MSNHIRTKASPPPRHDVRIDIWSGFTLVDPAIPELLPALCYDKLNFEPGAQGGISMGHQRHLWYALDSRNCLMVPTGFVPRVTDFAEALGLKVSVTDHREFGGEHQPDAGFLQGLPPQARSATDAMIDNPLGQIRVANDAELLDHLILIYRLFPAARIVVAVSTRGAARHLWKHMQGILEKPIGLFCSSSRRSIGRCQVTTFKYLNYIDADNTQILLLPDASQASAKLPQESLSRIAPHGPLRVYAFLTGQSPLDDTEALRIEAVAGRLIHSSVARQRPVRIAVADSYSAPQTKGLAGLDRKRAAYWNNGRRNERVAEVARSFAARNMTAIWGLGLLLDEDERFFEHRSANVAVLVESPEHGRRLQKLLPGWRLCMAGCDVPDEPAIITVAAVPRSGRQMDVLIVASGGDALPEMKLPDAETNARLEIIVVDFADDFDGWARDEGKLRHMGYMRRGWDVDQHRQTIHHHESKTRSPAALPAPPRVCTSPAAVPARESAVPYGIQPVRVHQDAVLPPPPGDPLPGNRLKESRKQHMSAATHTETAGMPSDGDQTSIHGKPKDRRINTGSPTRSKGGHSKKGGAHTQP